MADGALIFGGGLFRHGLKIRARLTGESLLQRAPLLGRFFRPAVRLHHGDRGEFGCQLPSGALAQDDGPDFRVAAQFVGLRHAVSTRRTIRVALADLAIGPVEVVVPGRVLAGEALQCFHALQPLRRFVLLNLRPGGWVLFDRLHHSGGDGGNVGQMDRNAQAAEEVGVN